MRAIRFLLQSAAALVAAVPLVHAQSVSVSATITGEIVPGVYGRVVLGNRPPPPVLYVQPVVAVPVWWLSLCRWSRSICTCRRVTRRTGASTATSTTPATGRCISCAPRSTSLAIVTSAAGSTGMHTMVSMETMSAAIVATTTDITTTEVAARVRLCYGPG